MKLIKSILINGALSIIGIALMLLLGEGIVRLKLPPQASVTRAPCIYLPDDELGYRFQPNASDLMFKNFEMDNMVQINTAGFHDINHPAVLDDANPRVLAIGDSFTAALEVPTDAGWTQTLQRELRRMGFSSAEVINLGIDGTGTNIHLKLLKKYLAQYQPNFVVLAFYKNDPGDLLDKLKHRECYKNYTLAYQSETEAQALRNFVDEARPTSDTFNWLYARSYLFRLFVFPFKDRFWRYGILNPTRNYYAPGMIGIEVDKRTQHPDDMDTLFAEFSALADEYHFRLLVVPVPANDTWNSPDDSIDGLRQSISPKTWETLEIIDVLPDIRAQVEADHKHYADLFFQYDEHFNAYGQYVYGTMVTQAIAKNLGNAPINLRVIPPQADLWSVVQWQDATGTWHGVENWQGMLNGGGQIRWWVAEKDYGSGPFRWAVFDAPDGKLLGASDNFFLPNQGESANISVVLQ